MRILQLHCSEFGYEVKKETPVAEQPPSPRKEKLENVLVSFICFEKKDESRVEEILKSLVENLKIDATRVGCTTVLLYPYAHLSKSLGSARLAKTFLSRLRDSLSEEGIKTHKSPFGWYKAFNLNCIGHPLAEAYREF
jgi:threonyl-tRNA synthetase